MKARWMVAWLILVIALAGGVIVGASTCYRGVTCEARGNCWFATWSGVMVRAAEGVWVNFTPSNSGLLHPYCHEVAVDAAGRVWVTHHMLGISLLDYGTSVVDITDDRWLTFTKADGLGSDFMIGAVAIDSQGRKWFGHDSGISILDDKGTPFDKSDDAWTQYIGGQSGLAVGPVNDILFDSQGCAWAATDFGVSRFCGGWTEFTWPGYPGGGLEGCPQWPDFPKDLALDKNGRVWLADLGCGAAMWDGSQWAIYDMHNSPLPVLSTGQDVGISAVEVDPFNNVWFGTRGRGAARLDGYNTWTLFSPSEGWTGPASIEAIGFDKKGSGWLASCNQPGGAHEILLGNSSRGIVTPGAGGVVYAPDRTGRIAFLPGAVNQPVAVTYQKADPASSPGYIAVRTFDLTAVVSGTTTPVTQFNKPYTMTMSYMPESLGFTDESTLGIYQQVGAAWQRLPTSQLDAARDRVEATLDHLSRFAVLGTIQQVYLPLLER